MGYNQPYDHTASPSTEVDHLKKLDDYPERGFKRMLRPAWLSDVDPMVEGTPEGDPTVHVKTWPHAGGVNSKRYVSRYGWS